MRTIVEYTPDSAILNADDPNKFETFLKTVIPKTRILFGLIKSYLRGRLSLYEAVSAMEPFMVYHRDISFKQYEEITEYINEKIAEYKRNYARKSREIAALARTKSKEIYPRLLILLDKDPGIKEAVIDGYGLRNYPIDNMTDSELIQIINSIDYGELMDAALALASTHLMVSGGVEKLSDLDKWSKQSKTTNDSTICSSKILAKKYLALDELEEDDNKEIYFDKQFDKTYYNLLDEYKTDMEAQLARAPPGTDMRIASIKVLSGLLSKAIGLDADKARRDATAMIDGQRLVEDGDYAVLIDADSDTGYRYYMRQASLWVLDIEISTKAFGDDEKIFCNLSDKCFAIKDDCLNLDTAKSEIQSENVSQIV